MSDPSPSESPQKNWLDHVKLVHQYHAGKKRAEPSWTMLATGKIFDLSEATVSRICKLAPHFEDPLVLNASTFQEAYRAVLDRNHKNLAVSLEDLDSAMENILSKPKEL